MKLSFVITVCSLPPSSASLECLFSCQCEKLMKNEDQTEEIQSVLVCSNKNVLIEGSDKLMLPVKERKIQTLVHTPAKLLVTCQRQPMILL